mmetsp:Transcript_33919/g.70528  ORF Transcript_33919/g.70528 Transcript_33919/m.70528 type:complete len:211 (-) Transcript_33919:189-821(-)
MAQKEPSQNSGFPSNATSPYRRGPTTCRKYGESVHIKPFANCLPSKRLQNARPSCGKQLPSKQKGVVVGRRSLIKQKRPAISQDCMKLKKPLRFDFNSLQKSLVAPIFSEVAKPVGPIKVQSVPGSTQYRSPICVPPNSTQTSLVRSTKHCSFKLPVRARVQVGPITVQSQPLIIHQRLAKRLPPNRAHFVSASPKMHRPCQQMGPTGVQ